MNENFARIVALAILGGVAKALFAKPQPITNNYYTESESTDLELIKGD